jgi:hypothetical protein
MKKTLLIVALFFCLIPVINAQKIYNTTSGEVIFGFSNAAYDAPNVADLPNNNLNGSIDGPMRFTIWFHFGTYWHYDFNNNFGIYSGIANRNIGFITNEASSLNSSGVAETTEKVKWKRRVYSIGAPLVLKFGSFEDDFYFFTGAQMEWLYHYKEKEFKPSGKRKYTEWFSSRVNTFLPSVFVGVTLPHGTSIKFTYALDDMMNKDYNYSDGNGNVVYPYKYMNSRMFYFSIFQMVRWDQNTTTKQIKEHKKIALL